MWVTSKVYVMCIILKIHNTHTHTSQWCSTFVLSLSVLLKQFVTYQPQNRVTENHIQNTACRFIENPPRCTIIHEVGSIYRMIPFQFSFHCLIIRFIKSWFLEFLRVNEIPSFQIPTKIFVCF